MLKFSVLSSGSKANSTVLQYKDELYLIDAGLSARQTEIRMRLLGFEPEKLKAILLTHEHSDHVYGLATLARKYSTRIICNAGTRDGVSLSEERESQFDIFQTGSSFQLGSLNIRSFSVSHDANDPVGFVVEVDGIRFGLATDLGRVTPLVEDALQGVHGLVLESNHDRDSLWSCEYPWALKQRISSRHGHISNEEAAELVCSLMHSGLQHLVLAHLSQVSNSHALAQQTFESVMYSNGIDLYESLTSFTCASVKEAVAIKELSNRIEVAKSQLDTSDCRVALS